MGGCFSCTFKWDSRTEKDLLCYRLLLQSYHLTCVMKLSNLTLKKIWLSAPGALLRKAIQKVNFFEAKETSLNMQPDSLRSHPILTFVRLYLAFP